MKFSKSTELAIHGLWMLANRRPGLLLVSEMADAQHVSQSYLAKVFQKLARKGLVRSTRGKRGGFALAREPDKIDLCEVVRAIEADEPLFDCMDVGRGCRGRSDCLLRETFQKAEQAMYDVLTGTSLADLMECGKGEDRAPWML